MTNTYEATQRRRRIDRVSAPEFVQGLRQRPLAELRAMRDECREEEAHLSFARKILQARLDIVRSVVARHGEGWNAEDLLEGLPQILADVAQPTTLGKTHVAPVTEPRGTTTDGRRTTDWLVLDASLGRVPDLDAEQLLELADRLDAEERRISGLRRTVLDHLDALQAELARRYAADAGAMSDVVSDVVRAGGGAQP